MFSSFPYSANRLARLVVLWASLVVLAMPAVVRAQDFTYTTNSDDTITITGYTGTGDVINIPSPINGRPVTSIGFQAFYYCTNLTSMTLPSSITNIGDYAFTFCSSLANVIIPERVNRIGLCAFSACTNLTCVIIATGVTSIGDYAFSADVFYPHNLILASTSRLTTVTIPSSVTNIGESAFNRCTSLTNLTIPVGVTSIGSGAFDGCSRLTDMAIPDGVTSIKYGTFMNCPSLVRVTMGNSLSCIGDSAFYGCYGLPSITIPASVTNIGKCAFLDCCRLANLSIPDGVTSIGMMAFWNCSSLTNDVAIPSDITSIEYGTFGGCSSLVGVTIPNGVTSIGGYAFQACTNLTSIAIPSSVISIGAYALNGCTSLKAVYFTGDAPSLDPYYCFAFDNSPATAYYEPGTSGWGAYYGGLPTVPLGYAYTTNGDNTVTITGYSGSGGDVTIPGTINGLTVTSIEDWAFASCTSLTSVTILAGVTSIGDKAFASCTSLTGITVDAANPNYSSLNGVLFDKNQTTLIQCPDGKSGRYTLPASVIRIEHGAFAFRTNLISVTIPASVTSIGDQAFAFCSSLTGIYFQGNKPSLGGPRVFFGDYKATVYYLPGTTGWDAWVGPPIVCIPYITVRVSGKVTKAGTAAGVAGVTITFSGGAGVATTDSHGKYAMPVPYGWSGTATTSFSNSWFDPPIRSYRALKANRTGQDYVWSPAPVISGNVRQSDRHIGVEGVTITFSGGAGIANTDASGNYTMTVPYKWSGTATASFSSGGFATPTKKYMALTATKSSQNYIWTPPPVISGKVTRSGAKTGMAGVTITASAGGGITSTGTNGNYSITVPYGWTGVVIAVAANGTFFPAGRSFKTKLTADRSAQNFIWTAPPAPADHSVLAGVTLATGGFAQWAHAQGLAGDPAELFGQVACNNGVTYGAEYAFGANLAKGEPLMQLLSINGVLTAEVPMQDPATLLDTYVTVEFTDDPAAIFWFPAVCCPLQVATPGTKQRYQAGHGDATDFRVTVRLAK